METKRKKKKVEVRFIGDKDVEIIVSRLKPGELKTPGRTQSHGPHTDHLATKKRAVQPQSDDLELYKSLLEEPNVDQSLCYSRRPSALFEDGDVSGHQIFGFQTPKRRNAMAQKAVESASNTPKTPSNRNAINTPKTPSSKSVNNSHTPGRSNHRSPPRGNVINCTPKGSTPKHTPKGNTSQTPSRTPKANGTLTTTISETPYNLRNKIKRKISQTVNATDSSSEDEAQDVSSSDSEWQSEESEAQDVSSSDSEGQSEESEDEKEKGNLSESENNDQEIVPRDVRSKQSVALLPTHRQLRTKKVDYLVAPEEYFRSHASSKVVTSNRTLSRLQTPRMAQDSLHQLLGQVRPSHGKAVAALVKRNASLFPRWMFALREGFNILVYGVGSKRNLLNTFHAQLGDNHVLVVNGFFPSLTIEEIVDSITKDILEIKNPPTDLFERVDFIQSTFGPGSKSQLYFIIHNIDGPMLRSDKNQEVLATLASAANIHLLASVDHINMPLLWDQTMLSLFNFSWWDATSFLPYVAETSFESSLLVQHSGGLTLASMENVFRSLTTNARSIFLLMVEFQLSNCKSADFEGMPYRDLYSSSREALLVSSDLALRAQLTEFLDHKLVKSKRGLDGSEMLIITIDSSILRQFMDKQSETL